MHRDNQGEGAPCAHAPEGSRSTPSGDTNLQAAQAHAHTHRHTRQSFLSPSHKTGLAAFFFYPLHTVAHMQSYSVMMQKKGVTRKIPTLCCREDWRFILFFRYVRVARAPSMHCVRRCASLLHRQVSRGRWGGRLAAGTPLASSLSPGQRSTVAVYPHPVETCVETRVKKKKKKTAAVCIHVAVDVFSRLLCRATVVNVRSECARAPI